MRWSAVLVIRLAHAATERVARRRLPVIVSVATWAMDHRVRQILVLLQLVRAAWATVRAWNRKRRIARAAIRGMVLLVLRICVLSRSVPVVRRMVVALFRLLLTVRGRIRATTRLVNLICVLSRQVLVATDRPV